MAMRPFDVDYVAVLSEGVNVKGTKRMRASNTDHAKRLVRQWTYGHYGAVRCSTPNCAPVQEEGV